MKIGAMYNHLNGYEWLQVHRKETWEEIEKVIASIDAEEYRTKKSKEKTMKDKMVFSPIDLNARMKKEFEASGWKESRFNYYVTDDYELTADIMHLPYEEQKIRIEKAGKTAISSYNQTDFQKDRVAIEVQLAKYSFIEFDLFVKHLGFYIGNTIDLGIEIIPTKKLQSEMSSGPGYFERVIHHIARQGRGTPAVPLILIGVEQD
ncbi:restriction endonuclease [Echinicola sp. CAU 1574]|uniref:Restriction endonuclease n=1 Tax=Echinicola arenosa TaxID=2774144 RepID=A0ABR9ALH3_9BACT|nr:BglII/BstYI family type II restriction endonuclease [Echinicola arenosa]MBD8489186.1 restriction endonuclease [Echinicola arenosa]